MGLFSFKKENDDWVAAMQRNQQPVAPPLATGADGAERPPAPAQEPVPPIPEKAPEKRARPPFFRRRADRTESPAAPGWWETQPPAHRLMRLLFWMIACFLLFAVGLLFFLKTYETVRANSGEVLAENTPTEIQAPFEARLGRVFVQEGSKVKKGDTLLVLENAAVQTAFRQSAAEVRIAEQGIVALERLAANLSAQLGQQQAGKRINAASGQSEKAAADSDLRGLREQVASEEKKLKIARDRHAKDQRLFGEGVISAQELQSKYATLLDQEKAVATLAQQLRQREIAKSNLPNVQADRSAQLTLAVLGRESELLNTQKTLATEQLRLETLRSRFRADSVEAAKQWSITPTDGFVSNMFNTRLQTNLVSKGQPLLVVVPAEEQAFYARLAINQRQVRDVRAGADVRLRVDAFHYLQFGIVPGEVTYVGKDTSAYFYVLVRLRPAENPRITLKNGYRVQGDIVLKQVRLWRFFWNKMFVRDR